MARLSSSLVRVFIIHMNPMKDYDLILEMDVRKGLNRMSIDTNGFELYSLALALSKE